MKHIVLNKYGRPYKVGEEVIIINPDHSMYDQIGEIFTIRNYDDRPKISVELQDGQVYSCKPDDIENI